MVLQPERLSTQARLFVRMVWWTGGMRTHNRLIRRKIASDQASLLPPCSLVINKSPPRMQLIDYRQTGILCPRHNPLRDRSEEDE